MSKISGRTAIKTEMGRRLDREIARLDMTVIDAANQIGCSRRTLYHYIQGDTSPDGVMLRTLDAQGFDVLYIVTGRRNR